jgi:hypothetical protein
VLTIIHNLAEDVVVVDGSTLRKTATLMSDDRSERLDPLRPWTGATGALTAREQLLTS